jgi:hypothetical protein
MVAGPAAAAQTREEFATGCFRALGHDFRVQTNLREIRDYLDHVLRDLAVEGMPSAWYGVEEREVLGKPWLVVTFDGEPLIRTPDAGSAVRMLLWHVNRTCVNRRGRSVVVHAAAAQRDGVVAVFPAPMEAGKTTLVARLVHDGWGYLTDEAAAIDPATFCVVPFPKPLSIDRGSWSVLSMLRPRLTGVPDHFHSGQWQVPASEINRVASDPGPVRLLVTPRYDPAQPTRLVPLRRIEMLRVLVEQTFAFDGPQLSTLANVVRGSDCYQLVVNDLDGACALLHDVVTRCRVEDKTREEPDAGTGPR